MGATIVKTEDNLDNRVKAIKEAVDNIKDMNIPKNTANIQIEQVIGKYIVNIDVSNEIDINLSCI